MKRVKRHRIKSEKPETSTSFTRKKEDYDLAFYIHDRVELMHQVFSVIKHKDLKAMAPECVRHISIDDLQELCTEELLGISSKRLCAILDGAEPPSDTESSSSQSPEHMETISLDSISSDDEILSQSSSEKSKKHKHRHNSKTKRKKSKDKSDPPRDAEHTRASRAGLTVLELLELQARARAIRAQLQQEQTTAKPAETIVESSDQDDVEIKEEPAEVVEISSDEDKLKVEPPDNNTSKESEKQTVSQTVTKRINDLVITVPQTKQTRKIKLNRNKTKVVVANTEKAAKVATTNNTNTGSKEAVQTTKKATEAANQPSTSSKEDNTNNKQKKKTKKKDKKKKVEKEGSDHDEITLQLSDTEKMDLLEDLDRKNYDKLSSSSSDSDSSSDESDTESEENNEEKNKNKVAAEENDTVQANNKSLEESKSSCDKTSEVLVDISKDINTKENRIQEEPSKNDTEVSAKGNETPKELNKDDETETVTHEADVSENKSTEQSQKTEDSSQDNDNPEDVTENANKDSGDQVKDTEKDSEKVLEVSSVDDIPVIESEQSDASIETSNNKELNENITTDKSIELDSQINLASTSAESKKDNIERETNSNSGEKDLSDGELSDRESSEIEAVELQPEVVCISDEDTSKKSHKKKKKKEKKSKKQKKAKKSKSDFRERGDQNFFEENPENQTDKKIDEATDSVVVIDECDKITEEKDIVVKLDEDSDDYDDVYEILELSDDSSCYEVEGTVLSKEPTAEEIEALSAKIDQIEREDVVTEEEIREHERREVEKNGELNEDNLENVSWKDRYLDSKKVKKVLSTSNIFNALRKKNRDLKKKLEESKHKDVKETEEKDTQEKEEEIPVETNKDDVEEGSIEHFNMLQGSTKYVDPVVEKTVNNDNKNETVDTEKDTNAITSEITNEIEVTGEMKKDAKQLLKMYKRLLKYNDITKQKDPNKKKKKKSKKKNKDSVVASAENSSI